MDAQQLISSCCKRITIQRAVFAVAGLGILTLTACSDSSSAVGDDSSKRMVDAREASAAFAITRAEWDREDHKLKVRGTAKAGSTVEIYDVVGGALLGKARAKTGEDGDDDDNRKTAAWKTDIKDLAAPPCRVRAQSGARQAEADVKNAPENCNAGGGGGGSGGGSSGGGTGGGGGTTASHAGRFDVYLGSATCAQCHASEVSEVHASVHYQWNGPTPYVVNLTSGGKLHGINDFCGYPDINFIGQLTNLDGQVVDGGCAQCHVGLGAKPQATASTAQLDNIDCLICHSDSYKRKVEKQLDGTFRFVPAPEKMSVPLLQAITDIQRTPTKGACVNCHSYAGGGCNNKRGDMEEAHRDPPSADFDVHMASTAKGGAGLLCVDCHTTAAHRIAGRGVDLQPTDFDTPVRCTNCHATTPHGNNDLDKHTARVDCTVCHIPTFARVASTDMLRDYSKPAQIDAAKRLYEPYIERAANVVPEYRFWNGKSTFYTFGSVANASASGRVVMAGPVGDIKDPLAKLFAFKHHLGVQPRDKQTQYLLPVKAGILFQTGNVDAAVKQGAADVGWPLTQGYDFAPTERFMGIFHEVAPRSNALGCSACHGGTRVDFALLGYTPLTTRNGRPLCASCHSDESGEWSAAQLFTRVHAKHVADENIRCSQCHAF